MSTLRSAFSQRRLLIVGYFGYFHIGAMLQRAVPSLGIPTEYCDATSTHPATPLIHRINWRFRDHQPANFSSFSKALVEKCTTHRPDVMLVTGITLPDAQSLSKIRDQGTVCVNYLTDDPWNPNHRAEWFMQALPGYDIVFSPRQANLKDLASIGCRAVYMPFAYDPSLHFPDPYPPSRENDFKCDVLFYGGADADRIPYIVSLLDRGYNVHLYGDYWNRFAQTRSAYKGVADIQTLRWAISGAKITLCLVRRANRDGHVMRTFEAPAMGACMLTEDTQEHRALFGNEGDAVLYFRSISEMNEKAAFLLSHDSERKRLIENAQALIAQEKNSYAARLGSMVNIALGEA